MKKSPLLLIAFFAALFTIFLFSCHPRTVTRNGIEMPYNEAAKLDFKDSEKALAKGKKIEAINLLNHLIKTYPASQWVDDAQSKLGDIYLADKRYQDAAIHFEIIRKNFRSSPLNLRATLRLGVCLYNLKKYDEVVATLVSDANDFTNSLERLEVYYFIASSYEQRGQPQNSLLYYGYMVQILKVQGLQSEVQTPFSTIPTKKTIEDRTIEIISETEDQKILRKVISAFGDSFPAQHALIRLAEIQLKDDRQSLAESNLEEFIRRFPNDFKIGKARTLLRRIQSRYLVNEQHIGVILPLSGKHRKFGQETLEGIELASSLMVDKFPNSNIQFIIKDSKSNPKHAADLVNDLVVNHQVIAIIGPLFSRTSFAAAEQALGIGVPMISLSSSEGLAEKGRYILQNSLVHKTQVRALVLYAMDKVKVNTEVKEKYGNSKRFAILYPDHQYGLLMRDLFWDEVVEEGGTIVGAESYKANATDFKNPVKKLVGLYYQEPRKEELEELERQAQEKGRRGRNLQLPPLLDFSALFIPDNYIRAGYIADHLPLFDIETKELLLLGDSNWNNPNLLKRSRYVQGAVFSDGFYLESENRDTRAFVANFRSAFNSDPKRHSAYAFDTAEFLIQLLQDPSNFSRNSLLQGILKMKHYPGVTGKISFDENGRVLKKPFLLRIERENIVEVKYKFK